MKSLSTIITTLALLAGSGNAALAAPSSLDMTCREVSMLVKERGAVILRTSPTVFGRYVNSAGLCEIALVAVPAWIPTKDSSECFVGYTCVLGSPQGSD